MFISRVKNSCLAQAALEPFLVSFRVCVCVRERVQTLASALHLCVCVCMHVICVYRVITMEYLAFFMGITNIVIYLLESLVLHVLNSAPIE